MVEKLQYNMTEIHFNIMYDGYACSDILQKKFNINAYSCAFCDSDITYFS